LLLTVLERDKKAIELSAVKLKQPYIEVIQTTMDKVTKDLANIRREFRKRNIKVYDEERTEKGIEYKYICRGYHSNFKHAVAYSQSLHRGKIGILFWVREGASIMKWGKDPNKRTIFGVWLDEKGIFQTEVAEVSGLSDSIVSKLCNDYSYKPTYMIFRKLMRGLGELVYEIEYEDFW
jgi:hypothetical protein